MLEQTSFTALDISSGHTNDWMGWVIAGCLAIAFFISMVVLPLQRRK